MPRAKSRRQIRFLLSKASPLTPAQKRKLKSELHRGTIRIKHKKKR